MAAPLKKVPFEKLEREIKEILLRDIGKKYPYVYLITKEVLKKSKPPKVEQSTMREINKRVREIMEEFETERAKYY